MRVSRRTLVAIAAVFGCALVAYAAALGGGFLFDDLHAVQDNRAIRSLGNVPSFFWDLDAFSSIDMRMYRPVLLTTLAVDWTLSGGAPWLFKLTNVLIHGACAALLFVLARRLRVRFAAALTVALLFAAHPMAAESINLVSSRSDQLMVLGLCCGLLWHHAAMRGSRLALGGTALAALVACGAKETGVVLPACLLVLEFARARGGGARHGGPSLDWRAAAVRLLPSTAVVLGYLCARRLLFGVATVAVPKLSGGADVINGSGRDLVTQLCAMGHALPKFVAQAFVPLGLSADPFVPLHDDFWSFPVLAGWTLIGLATAWGLWTGLGGRGNRGRPAVLVGTCLAWATALPWVVIPLNMPAAEHRFYGALLGIALAVAAIVPRRLPRRTALRALAAALVVVFAAGSASRSLQYREPLRLWQGCLDLWPDSVRGLCGRALAYHDRAWQARHAGDEAAFEWWMRAACRDLGSVVRRHPRFASAVRNLVEFHLELGPGRGQPVYALTLADALLRWKPDNPFYLLLQSRCLVQVAARTGEPRFLDEAERAALRCLEVAEPKGLVYRQAANVRVAMGDLEGAIAHLDRSVERGLDHESVLLDRAALLLQAGRTREATDDLRRVLAADPFDPRARKLLRRIGAPSRPR